MIRIGLTCIMTLFAVPPALLLTMLFFLGQAMHLCGVALQDGAEAALRRILAGLDRIAGTEW